MTDRKLEPMMERIAAIAQPYTTRSMDVPLRTFSLLLFVCGFSFSDFIFRFLNRAREPTCFFCIFISSLISAGMIVDRMEQFVAQRVAEGRLPATDEVLASVARILHTKGGFSFRELYKVYRSLSQTVSWTPRDCCGRRSLARSLG